MHVVVRFNRQLARKRRLVAPYASASHDEPLL